MITALPTPPTRSDPANFATRADAFLAALPQFVAEANALEQSLQLVATTGTSTTSLTIGTGTKSLTTQTGKAWVAGAFLYVVSAVSVANIMVGQVSAYNGATGALSVSVASIGGSGTFSSWVIGLSAPDSLPAALAGGTAGALPYQTGANATAFLAPGTSGHVLRSGGAGAPAWAAPADVVADATAAIGALSLRNVLINGHFAVNQRQYVSGTATTGANQYTLDRWRVVVSGQSLTFSASENGNQVTAPAGGLEQVVESVNIAGGSYTLSWTGTATATINGTAVANGGTVALPANTNATVRFSGGTVARAQLELGSVATAFERRPLPIELAMCQRYFFRKAERMLIVGLTSSGGPVQCRTCVPFPVQMRAAPTAVFSYTDNGNMPTGTLEDIGPTGCQFRGETFTAAAQGASGQIAAGATFSAEL